MCYSSAFPATITRPFSVLKFASKWTVSLVCFVVTYLVSAKVMHLLLGFLLTSLCVCVYAQASRVEWSWCQCRCPGRVPCWQAPSWLSSVARSDHAQPQITVGPLCLANGTFQYSSKSATATAIAPLSSLLQHPVHSLHVQDNCLI